MNSNGLFFLIFMSVFIFSFTTNVKAEGERNPAQTENTDLFFLCKNNKSTRWLRAFKLDNGKCHTTYSKEGYLQVISSATYFSSCEAVLHNVRKNIEEGGFKCFKLESYSYLDLE